jgi:hypothetical protein
MEKLENEYPNVTFVYMTGHLEGLGPDGSLYTANQKIRDYCKQNDKYLFDFADIEKYDPDGSQNYMNYFADDECDYDPDGKEPINRSQNWANNWLTANPDHVLTKISEKCGHCSHSVSINCVKKGIAAWYLWAQLAGWVPEDNGVTYSNIPVHEKKEFDLNAHFEHNSNVLKISLHTDQSAPVSLRVFSITGQQIYSRQLNGITSGKNEFQVPMEVPKGIYIVRINNRNESDCIKILR